MSLILLMPVYVPVKDKDKETPTRTILAECLDSVKAKEESQQPIKLLKRAFKNLDAIDMEGKSLTTSESLNLVRQIDEIIKKLKRLKGSS